MPKEPGKRTDLTSYQVDTRLESVKVQYNPARVQRWKLVSLIPQPAYRAEREALLRIQCQRWAKRQPFRARYSFEKLEEGTVHLPARADLSLRKERSKASHGSPTRLGGTLENGLRTGRTCPSATWGCRTRPEASTRA